MRVIYSRRLLDHFKRFAKRAYPREAYAILLGTQRGDSVRIRSLYIPDDQDRFTSNDVVRVQEKWWLTAGAIAREEGSELLGDLHSHPASANFEFDAAPSQADYDRIDAPIQGICCVRRYKSGRMAAIIKFWPATNSITERALD